MVERGNSASPAAATAGSVARAFSVLQTVVAAERPVGVRELGRRTGLPRSTASRLVAQLADLGMVDRAADGSVVPGSALATLAVAGPRPILRDRLRPLLTALAEEYGESAALAVDDGDALLYVAQVDAVSAVRAPDVRAERHPFHVVAHGLALMAHWSPDRLAEYLSRPLAAPTTASMTDPAAIRRRLESIRADGVVWTMEEFDVDVNGVATVVFDGDRPVASVGLYGPSYRLSPALRPDLARDLVSRVQRQAAALL